MDLETFKAALPLLSDDMLRDQEEELRIKAAMLLREVERRPKSFGTRSTSSWEAEVDKARTMKRQELEAERFKWQAEQQQRSLAEEEFKRSGQQEAARRIELEFPELLRMRDKGGWWKKR